MFYFQIFLILKSWSYFPSIHWLNPSLWFLYRGFTSCRHRRRWTCSGVSGCSGTRQTMPPRPCWTRPQWPPGPLQRDRKKHETLLHTSIRRGENGGGGADTIKWYYIYNIFEGVGQIRFNDTIFTIFLVCRFHHENTIWYFDIT